MASALIRFAQGTNTDIAGRAVKGDLVSGAVTVSNGTDTGIVSWKYELLYVPPGSLIPLQTQGPGNIPAFVFVEPDAPGSYRVRLTTTDGVGGVDVDIRNFCVPFPHGQIAPPNQGTPLPLPLTGPGAKPNELNIGGQIYGWDGDGDATRPLLYGALKQLDATAGTLTTGATGTVLTAQGVGNAPQWVAVPSTPVATTSTTGTVTLAGDLGGTGATPSVLQVHGASVPAAGSLVTGLVLQVTGANALGYGTVGAGGITPGTAYQALVSNATPATTWQTLTLGATAPIAVTNSGNVVQGTTISVASATTSTLGVVELSGDLGGSATSPSVLQVHGASVPAAGALTTGNVLQVSGASALSYGTIGAASIAAGAVTLAKFDTTGAAGTVLANAVANTPTWTSTPALTSLSLGTSPALTGALQLANAASVSFRNAANNADYNLIASDASNNVNVGDTNTANARIACASAGGIYLEAGGTTYALITNTGVSVAGQVTATTFAIAGSSASSGAYRLPNNTYIACRNAANNADYHLIAGDASNSVNVGDTNTTNATVTCASAGGVYLKAGGTTYALITNTGVAVTGQVTATTFVSAGATPANSGVFRLPNNTAITYRNAANSLDLVLISADGSNDVWVAGAGSPTTTLVAGTAVDLAISSTTILAATSAGVTVTGVLSATGNIRAELNILQDAEALSSFAGFAGTITNSQLLRGAFQGTTIPSPVAFESRVQTTAESPAAYTTNPISRGHQHTHLRLTSSQTTTAINPFEIASGWMYQGTVVISRGGISSDSPAYASCGTSAPVPFIATYTGGLQLLVATSGTSSVSANGTCYLPGNNTSATTLITSFTAGSNPGEPGLQLVVPSIAAATTLDFEWEFSCVYTG